MWLAGEASGGTGTLTPITLSGCGCGRCWDGRFVSSSRSGECELWGAYVISGGSATGGFISKTASIFS